MNIATTTGVKEVKKAYQQEFIVTNSDGSTQTATAGDIINALITKVNECCNEGKEAGDDGK